MLETALLERLVNAGIFLYGLRVVAWYLRQRLSNMMGVAFPLVGLPGSRIGYFEVNVSFDIFRYPKYCKKNDPKLHLQGYRGAVR
jgi:hypothetical protein